MSRSPLRRQLNGELISFLRAVVGAVLVQQPAHALVGVDETRVQRQRALVGAPRRLHRPQGELRVADAGMVACFSRRQREGALIGLQGRLVLAEAEVNGAEPGVGLHGVGVATQRALVGRQRVVDAPFGQADIANADVRPGPVGGQLGSPVEGGERIRAPAQPGQRPAAKGIHGWILLVHFLQPLVDLRGHFHLPQRKIAATQLQIDGYGVAVRLQFQRPLIGGDGLVVLGQLRVGAGQAQVGAAPRRVQRDCLLVGANGGPDVVLVGSDETKPAIGVGVVGSEGQRPLEQLFGLVDLLQGQPGIGEAAHGLHVVRRQREGLSIGFRRLRRLLLGGVNRGKAFVSRHFFRRQTQRALEGGSRQIVVLQLQMGIAQADIGPRFLWLQTHGAPVSVQRLVVCARGEQGIAEAAVERVILRGCRQSRPVGSHGRLVQTQSLVNRAEIAVGCGVRVVLVRQLVSLARFLVAPFPIVNACQPAMSRYIVRLQLQCPPVGPAGLVQPLQGEIGVAQTRMTGRGIRVAAQRFLVCDQRFFWLAGSQVNGR